MLGSVARISIGSETAVCEIILPKGNETACSMETGTFSSAMAATTTLMVVGADVGGAVSNVAPTPNPCSIRRSVLVTPLVREEEEKVDADPPWVGRGNTARARTTSSVNRRIIARCTLYF
jgi:hypothetical protein